MTPEQFTRACYDLEFDSLPRDIQDAWREFALGTLKVMLEKWQDRGYGYTKPSVHDMLDYASKLAVDTSMKCTSKCLGSGDDWNVRHLDNNGNWFGCICAAYLTYAIAADKRNQK